MFLEVQMAVEFTKRQDYDVTVTSNLNSKLTCTNRKFNYLPSLTASSTARSSAEFLHSDLLSFRILRKIRSAFNGTGIVALEYPAIAQFTADSKQDGR
jgi:hypothetical protein